MVNKNIQMKQRENDTWNNLYPISLNKNILNENGYDLDKQFDDVNTSLSNTKIEINKELDLLDKIKNEIYIDVKNNEFINAIGDGVKHTISNIFPDVTLEEVKKLDSNATLENSADWYAIQTLINLSIESGRELFLTAGDYIIDLPLKYKPFFKIRGQGINSILRSFVSNEFLLRHKDIHSMEGRSDFVSIKDFTIYGTGHQGTGGGIHFRHGGHNSIIENMWVKYFTKENQVGIKLSRTWYLYINNCDISNNTNGVVFGNTMDETHVNNVILRDSKIYGILEFSPKKYGKIGITLNGGSGNIISGCQIEGWTTGVLNNSDSVAAVVENSYYEDITYRQNSNNGKMFKLINTVFIHIASNSNVTYLHTSSSAVGSVYENLVFRHVPLISMVFDDKGSKDSLYINLQAEGQYYESWITTDDIYKALPSNVHGIGFDKINNTSVLTNNREVSFTKGIVLPKTENSPLIENTLYVNKYGKLMFYDGITFKEILLQ